MSQPETLTGRRYFASKGNRDSTAWLQICLEFAFMMSRRPVDICVRLRKDNRGTSEMILRRSSVGSAVKRSLPAFPSGVTMLGDIAEVVGWRNVNGERWSGK